jgi:hypothetical protein
VSGPAGGLVLTAEDEMAVRAYATQVVAWPPPAKAHDYGVVGRPLGTWGILSPLWHGVNTLRCKKLQRLAELVFWQSIVK